MERRKSVLGQENHLINLWYSSAPTRFLGSWWSVSVPSISTLCIISHRFLDLEELVDDSTRRGASFDLVDDRKPPMAICANYMPIKCSTQKAQCLFF